MIEQQSYSYTVSGISSSWDNTAGNGIFPVVQPCGDNYPYHPYEPVNTPQPLQWPIPNTEIEAKDVKVKVRVKLQGTDQEVDIVLTLQEIFQALSDSSVMQKAIQKALVNKTLEEKL